MSPTPPAASELLLASRPFAGAAGGVRVRIKVTPRARHAGVTGLVNDADGAPRLKVAVTAAATGGQANTAVLALLADEYLLKVRAMAQQPPQGERARRAAVLGLLDAAHALRHVLEHHHEREHQALAHELPESLQAAAWNGVEPGGA